MKTKTINLYEFDELSTEAQEKAISEHINFEIAIMTNESPYYHLATEMEKMRTPWFLPEVIYDKCKQAIIETIKANEYTFTIDSKLENI
jgi:hypothetical protein